MCQRDNFDLQVRNLVVHLRNLNAALASFETILTYKNYPVSRPILSYETEITKVRDKTETTKNRSRFLQPCRRLLRP